MIEVDDCGIGVRLPDKGDLAGKASRYLDLDAPRYDNTK
jgi:hypothetical protein